MASGHQLDNTTMESNANCHLLALQWIEEEVK